MGDAAHSWSARVAERAEELGFDAVGFARADEPLDEDHAHYLAFVEQERHGSMAYLADHADVRRRLDHPGILPGARSVVCLARRYDRPDEAGDPPLTQRIARYARGRDYHGHLRKRLRKLAAFVRSLGPGVEARALVDTAPVLERAWAARSGLGFVGKNGLLIVPGQGSYCLLGEVVTTLPLDRAAPAPLGERCGSCVLCLDACPTDAFAAPYVLDARRCVSYATIERRLPAPPELEDAMGDHLFGCDVCQEVCPYNRAPTHPAADAAPFEPLPRWNATSLEALASADAAAWDTLSRGTPLRRATRAGLARNAALVAAKHGDARALRAAAGHDDPEVAQLARRLEGSGLSS